MCVRINLMSEFTRPYPTWVILYKISQYLFVNFIVISFKAYMKWENDNILKNSLSAEF